MQRYETHKMKNPQVPFIAHQMKQRPNHNTCIGNWHENIEIILITQGEGRFQNGEVSLQVKPGDTILIDQNRLHTIPAGESLDYLCIIPDRSFFLENHLDTNDIHFLPMIRDDYVTHLIETFVKEYFEQDTPFRIQALRAYALELITVLCRKYSQTDEKSQSDTRLQSAIKQAIGKIRSESNQPLSLDEIANFVGMSKYYFARQFHRITGYSVFSYLNLVRCENAKILLSQPQLSIGEISATCGFSDQSYFAKTFRNYTGKTPTEYRNQSFLKHREDTKAKEEKKSAD